MAYNELLADRLRQTFKSRNVFYQEKQMMGGLSIMVDDKMCAGVIKEDLMLRVGPEFYDEALKIHGCREMDFTKRPLKGFVFISPDAIDLDTDLEFWVDKALEYNPIAKSSKKK